MNKTYKVVFNKARGALMAVNELTGTIQKKGSKTIVASCALLMPFMAIAADGDLALQGTATTIDQSYQASAENHKVIGGWDIYKNNLTEVTVDTQGKTKLTIDAGYSLDEAIGGNAAKQIASTDANNFSLSSSSTTINNTSGIQSIIGGSKANNASGNFDINTTELTINGGSGLGKGGVVTGGSYLKATPNSTAGLGGTASSHVEKTTLTITNGSFETTVVGGSYAEVYGTGSQTADMSVTTNNIENTITGGTFTDTLGAGFIGGSVATGQGATASVGTATTTIKGGQDFSGVFNGNIHAGSLASNGGTATTSNTVLNLQGNSSEDLLKFQKTPKAIYAGGLNSAVTDRLEMNLTNVDMNTSSDSKWGIYGGSKFNIGGTYSEGSSFITVNNSQINGDIRGGAGVFGSDITLSAGTTSVRVENSQISGYDQGGSTWQGRVFGNGLMEKAENSSMYYAESSVFIGDNVFGVTVDKDTGTITHNPGTAVYGASQLNGAINSISTTGKTSVTVTGENTELEEVYGGGIISGTLGKEKLSTIVVGQSEVTFNSGLISAQVVGGNISNFFGYSVIGNASEDGLIEFNGQRYDEGSTHVTINGGDLSSAFVFGGSYADWGWYAMNAGSTESTSERTAIVVGKSTVDINGGSIQVVVGGGGAVISMQDGSTYASGSNSPDSLVYGQTAVNVTNGEIQGLIGGGFAQGQRAEMDPDATVHGSTEINISGGTITEVFGGGYVSGYGKADVTGDVSIHLSGGNIDRIVAGGHTENESASAVVKGNAVVVFEKDFGFDGTVSGEGVNGTSTLQFGTGESSYEGSFGGTFSNFEVLSIANGSTLQLETLSNENIGSALTVDGAGLLKIKALSHDAGTLTLAAGTLDVESISMTQAGALVVDGGSLSTTTNQIFTNALQSGQETDAGALLANGVTFTAGSLALKDDLYSLVYAESAGKLLSDSNTNVVFLGNLASTDGIGDSNNQATIDDLVNVGPNVVLEQVTATTVGADNDGRNLQIGGTLSDEASSNTVLRSESLSVAALDLGTGTTVTITDGKQLNLAGLGGELISSTATSADDNSAVMVLVQNGATLGLGVGAATPDGGVLSAKVNLDGNDSAMKVVGNAHYEVEALTGSGTVTVGDETSSSSLTIHSLDGMTGLIFVDPAWNLSGANPVSDASKLVIAETGAITADIVAGQNSLVSFGADASDAVSSFDRIAAAQGVAWKDDVTAAAYIGAPVDLTNGSLTIDGSLTTPPSAADIQNGVHVAAQGMLIADQKAVPADGELIKGEVVFAENSLLGLANASEGTFKLATSSSGTATVVTDNPFIEGSLVADGSGVVSTVLNADTGLTALASTGLQAMTRRADSVLAGTIADRTSIDQELNAGINLWVDVRGENYQADDFDNGGEFDADMGYGTFGGDVAFGAFTAGAAFQYGTGSLRSSVSSIKNSIDNYAFALYGTYKVTDAFKLAAELAYVWGENDISSSQAALNQSVDTEMYSFGLRAMYELKAGNFSFVPSIGLRVSQLSTDAFQVGSVKVEDQDQTLVQVPIALRINASEINASGWSVAPSFKIAYVPTFGDKDIEVLNHTQDVIDTAPVQADFGLRIGKDNMMFNVNMLLGAGEYGTSAIGGKVGFKYAF